MTVNTIPGGSALIDRCTLHKSCGCHVAACCLQCPLPQCIYEDAETASIVTKALIHQEVLERIVVQYIFCSGDLTCVARNGKMSKRNALRYVSEARKLGMVDNW